MENRDRLDDFIEKLNVSDEYVNTFLSIDRYRYGVYDESNNLIPLYISPLKEGDDTIPSITFVDLFSPEKTRFCFPISNKLFMPLLELLKMCLRKLPYISIGEKSIKSKLKQLKEQLMTSTNTNSNLKIILRSFKTEFPFVMIPASAGKADLLLFFSLSSFCDPHVNISTPIIRFDVCEGDGMNGNINGLYNFRIINASQFYIDLAHFDTRLNINFNKICR